MHGVGRCVSPLLLTDPTGFFIDSNKLYKLSAEKSNKSSGSLIPLSLKPSSMSWEMCICSACVQNFLVVVEMNVNVKVVILELLFCFYPVLWFMKEKHNFKK